MAHSPTRTDFESLFHASSLDLVIPEHSSVTSTAGLSVQSAPQRHVAFLDEKLAYFVSLGIPDEVLSSPSSRNEPPSELLRYLSRLQLTMSASLLPQLTSRPAEPPSAPPTSATATLSVPNIPHRPHTPDSSVPPITPNPRPAASKDDEAYAGVEGVTVWEGAVDGSVEEGNGGRSIERSAQGWEVIWKGYVPIAYVRTQIQEPVLSLTASATLREAPVMIRAGHAETASIASLADTIRTEGTVTEDTLRDDGTAGLEEIDLLGGLGEERLPSTRLGPSLREDLSLPDLSTSSAPLTAVTPSTAHHLKTPSTASAPPTGTASRERHAPVLSSQPAGALRKSYRRILSLSSGLRVRMRSLFLPQILPPRLGETEEEDEEGEKRVALCIELENPVDSVSFSFQITGITVDVGGKGGKAVAELVCHPGDEQVFPLTVDPSEQVNVLYAVSMPSSGDQAPDVLRPTGPGDMQRPVAITVVGRPILGERHPTDTFSSRWNCTLDLASLQPSEPTSSIPARPISTSKPVPPAPNAIVGDKRYSLASLQSSLGSRPVSQRIVSGPSQRPLALPSQVQGGRVLSMRTQAREGYGLLVSVKILDSEHSPLIKPLEPFSLEVFVHNRTDEVKRFRLGVPTREGGGRVKEAWAQRRPRKDDEAEYGVDDPVLRQLLLAHVASTPAIVPLEDDVRCGPLLPGASMAARIRFLALRDGVHSIDKLRITGANDEFDFVMTPVLDVVVGSGIDIQ